ncbi:hypothetical protein L6164_015621 [Bauhinia variegata]|uniref:Uncharacterized protein n=1 Tax=Bauhinia variegata TaxID=167791 RepID=A0ACB9NN80_BAUVA|nr:hypothetical protein L6164_015621 [Bauhinia variegata]
MWDFQTARWCLTKKTFNIGLCQLSVTPNKERNIVQAIEEAARKGAQLVHLSEIWNSPYSNDSTLTTLGILMLVAMHHLQLQCCPKSLEDHYSRWLYTGACW